MENNGTTLATSPPIISKKDRDVPLAEHVTVVQEQGDGNAI